MDSEKWHVSWWNSSLGARFGIILNQSFNWRLTYWPCVVSCCAALPTLLLHCLIRFQSALRGISPCLANCSHLMYNAVGPERVDDTNQNFQWAPKPKAEVIYAIYMSVDAAARLDHADFASLCTLHRSPNLLPHAIPRALFSAFRKLEQYLFTFLGNLVLWIQGWAGGGRQTQRMLQKKQSATT